MLSAMRWLGFLLVGTGVVSLGHAQKKDMLKMIESFKWVSPNVAKEVEGIEHRTFYSKSNQTEVGYYVNYPEGYNDPENTGKRYPVIYSLHGGRPGAESKGLNGFKNFRASRAGDQLRPISW